MSAYLIFTRDKTLDARELATYSKDVPATLAGHPVKVLALYGQHEDLEGASTEGTVILEFQIFRRGRLGMTARHIGRSVSTVSKGDVPRHVGGRSLRKPERRDRTVSTFTAVAVPTQSP